MAVITKKICLVGDFGVGKTSLIRRFVEGQFSDRYLSTVGVKISRKIVELPIKGSSCCEQLQLLVWDIEGSNKFKGIAPTYFQGAKGAVIVGDVSMSETLNHISDHVQNFLAVNPDSYIAIALNKSDLIEAEYLEKIRQKYQAHFSNNTQVLLTSVTSAKTGNNVNEIFQYIAQFLIN